MAEPGTSDARDTRRGFLRTATLAVGGVVGAVLGIPLVRYFLYPVGRKVVTASDGPVDVLAASSLVSGGPPVQVPVVAAAQRDAWTARDQVAVGSVWLSKDKSGKVQALSAVCPHLGCAIGYDPQADQFRCPCHKSTFHRDGEKIAGPTKRGMDPLPVEVADGRVRVTFVHYRSDVPERTPV